jgi:sensor histidine kinase YesM
MMFRTFRSQLLWNFVLAISILLVVAMSVVVSMFAFFNRADELIASPTELAAISAELNQVHQYIANFVNYDDPSYLGLYRSAMTGLVDRLNAFETTAREISRTRSDVEFMYSYFELQKQLEWYRDTGEFLIARIMEGEEERFLRFDRLYSLRDLKGRITGALSDLLFRQMNHTQVVYAEYRSTLRYQWITLFSIFGLAVIALVHWVSRQASTISRPIRHLVEQGRRIAAHDFEVERAPDVHNQELQTLNETFLEMAQGVARSFEVLSQKNVLERTNLEMAQSLKQAELELLQSQINPHFLFNTLNTITSLAQIENAEETERLLTSFSTLLRFNLRNMHTVVPVARELEIIDHYLFIQKQRFGERLRYFIDSDEDVMDARIPSLTIQPLVENALIPGIEPVRGGGSVAVIVTAEERGEFLVIVCDSGRGIPPAIVERLEENTRPEDGGRDHMGLENTIRRLRLYDPDLAVKIDTAPGCGTQISIRIHPPAGEFGTASA